MVTKHLKPRDGLKVRNPNKIGMPHIKTAGEKIRMNRYWWSLLRRGDVVEVTKPDTQKNATPKPEEGSKDGE